MRRFSFKVDLRKPKDTQGGGAAEQPGAAPAVSRPTDGFALSDALRPQRRGMREWPSYQRALAALPTVTTAADDFEDPDLAEEYVRIHGVTRQKILDAAPGFDTEGKTEIHCFFEEDGSKHLVSRLLARPNARVTELSLYVSGEVTRVYYENAGGPDQDLDDLYESGLAGLDEDVARFARFPNYQLKFVLLPCEGSTLVEIYRGACVYDAESGGVVTHDE